MSSKSIEEDFDMMTRESTSLTGSAPDNDPESQDLSAYNAAAIVHRKHGGETYENVFTIDDEDLGSDPNVLMVPLSYKRRKCVHRWVMCFGILFGLVTLSLGVLYVLDLNGVEVPDKYNPLTIVQVTHVPEDIADTCSSTSLKSLEGWDKCRKICTVAKCCVIPINEKGSCLHKYEKSCSKYFHYCKTMFDSDGVPPAGLSTTTEDVTEKSNNDAPPTFDKESGGPTYDHENGPTGTDLHTLNLTPGNPNLEMSEKDWAITLDNITKVCRQDVSPPYHLQDGAKCHSYCQDLKCCFSDDTDYSCYTEYGDYCDQFYMCGVMYNANDKTEEEEGTTITIDPSVQEVCSNQYIFQNDDEACEAKCSERECCFIPENQEGSCFLNNPSWCEEYIPCTNAEKYAANQSKDDTMSGTLQEVCTEAYVNKNGKKDCETKCEDGACCFLPMGDENSCFLKSKEWCEGFIPCTKIDQYDDNSGNNDNNNGGKNKENEVDNIVSLVKQACYISPVKASTADYSKCANLCQSRMCCFQSDENLSCYKDKTDWCEEFSPCYKLNINDLIGKTTSGAVATVDETEMKVEQACSESSLETLSGMANCGKLCVDKKCCFDSDLDNASSSSIRKGGKDNESKCVIETCEEYKSCKPFFTQTSKSKVELESLCTRDKISDNYNTCSHICSQRSCCFNWGQEGNCYDNNENWCNEFHHCYNLNWADVSKEETSTVISEACSKMNVMTDAGRERCLSLCEDHTCCFSQTDDNCYKQETEFCVGYESCRNLYISPKDMTEEFCAKDKISTALGYSVCSVLCTGRSCCFQDKGSNKYCYNDFSSWCDEFSSCYNIDSITEVVNSYNSDTDGYIVNDVCTADKLKSGDGIKDCEDICSERYCCFESGRNNCYEENTSWCDEFKACKLLDDLSGKSIKAQPKEQNAEQDVDDICSNDNISTSKGLQECKEACEDHACCFAKDEGLNCFDDPNESCDLFKSCQNLLQDVMNNGDTDNNADDGMNDGVLDPDVEKVNTYCTKAAINDGDNYNTCKNLCQPRECCFHWGKENCYEEKEDWCDDFTLCYNLDWADEVDNQDSKGDLTIVMEEACSKLNLLTEAGGERCQELCEDRECCFDPDLSQNCWQSKPGFCEGYEACANLNIKDEDMVKEFCSKEKVSTGLGYAVCEVMCTTRPCCFYEGEKNCAKEFPIWCSSMQSCNENLDMPTIMKNMNDKSDGNIVAKVCSDDHLSSEGKEGKKDCKELCSERACCFLPGRDNCSNKYPDWCDEFAVCGKLDLFSEDNTDDEDYDQGDDGMNVADEDNINGDNNEDTNDNEEEDPEVQALEKVCAKSVINDGDNYNQCKNLCQARECCFHWGKQNCVEDKEIWCDDFRLCYNLDWADEVENKDSKGDLLIVLKESCSKLNLLTEAGSERCEELCEDRECCVDPDMSQNCWQDRPDFCEGYEPCANLNIKDEDTVKEFCTFEKVATGIGYAVCEVMCTTRPCCFAEGDKNCAKDYPAWCSALDICAQNLDMPAVMKSYDEKTDSNIVSKVCDGVEFLPKGHQSRLDCREICSERGCCFLAGRDNCASEYGDWCDEFSACAKLDLSKFDGFYGDDTDNDAIPIPNNSTPNINDVCSVESVKGTGRGDCQAMCQQRDCCFTMGVGNCFATKEDWCDEYKACQNLFSN